MLQQLSILMVDLGLETMWGFHPEVQFLAAEGFNVLQNNIRGSSGYGLKHMTEVYGNFDTVLEDMFDSIEFLDSEGLVDTKIRSAFMGVAMVVMPPLKAP